MHWSKTLGKEITYLLKKVPFTLYSHPLQLLYTKLWINLWNQAETPYLPYLNFTFYDFHSYLIYLDLKSSICCHVPSQNHPPPQTTFSLFIVPGMVYLWQKAQCKFIMTVTWGGSSTQHRTPQGNKSVKLRSCKPHFENYFYESFITLYLVCNALVANSLKA